MRRFNAGEIEALAERFADRADWRLFAWSSKLGHLEIVAPDRAEAFIEERFAEMEETEPSNPFREPWEALQSGADEAGLRLVLVRAAELAEGGGPPVPALVFGLRHDEGGEELVFATVFGELMEEVALHGTAAVLEQGVGVDPDRARGRD